MQASKMWVRQIGAIVLIVHLCAGAIPSTKPLTCYTCSDPDDPEDCALNEETCGLGQMCYSIITKRHDLHYELGCMDADRCLNEMKRNGASCESSVFTSGDRCAFCCTGNHCNVDALLVEDIPEATVSEKSLDFVQELKAKQQQPSNGGVQCLECTGASRTECDTSGIWKTCEPDMNACMMSVQRRDGQTTVSRKCTFHQTCDLYQHLNLKTCSEVDELSSCFECCEDDDCPQPSDVKLLRHKRAPTKSGGKSKKSGGKSKTSGGKTGGKSKKSGSKSKKSGGKSKKSGGKSHKSGSKSKEAKSKSKSKENENTDCDCDCTYENEVSQSNSKGGKSKGHGSKSKGHGSKSKEHGSKSKGHGSKSKDHGSKSKDHGSKSKGHGSKSNDKDSGNDDNCHCNCTYEGNDSNVTDSISKDKDSNKHSNSKDKDSNKHSNSKDKDSHSHSKDNDSHDHSHSHSKDKDSHGHSHSHSKDKDSHDHSHSHSKDKDSHDHSHSHSKENNNGTYNHTHGHSHGKDSHDHSHSKEIDSNGTYNHTHGHSHGKDSHDHSHSHGKDSHDHSHGKDKDSHDHSHGKDSHDHSHGKDSHDHSHGKDSHDHSNSKDKDCGSKSNDTDSDSNSNSSDKDSDDCFFGGCDSSDSDSKDKDSGSKDKDSHSKDKDSHSKDKDSHSKDKDSHSKDKDSHSKDKDSGSKDKDSGSKDKDSHSKDKDSHSKDKDSHSKDKDSHSKDKDSHSKDKDSHSKDKDSHSKDKDSHSKDKDSHSKDKDSHSKERHSCPHSNTGVCSQCLNTGGGIFIPNIKLDINDMGRGGKHKGHSSGSASDEYSSDYQSDTKMNVEQIITHKGVQYEKQYDVHQRTTKKGKADDDVYTGKSNICSRPKARNFVDYMKQKMTFHDKRNGSAPGKLCYACSEGTVNCTSNMVTSCDGQDCYCVTRVRIDENGKLEKAKGCADNDFCRRQWLEKTAVNNDCFYITEEQSNANRSIVVPLECTFCCQGNLCNNGFIPDFRKLLT